MPSPQPSPYLPPAAALEIPTPTLTPTSIRSRWITALGLLFSLPFLVVGLTGLIMEWTDRATTETSEFIYGMLLATALLSTPCAVMAIARFAGKSLHSPWGRVFRHVGQVAVLAALPYALVVLYSNFNRSELFEGLAKTLFVNGMLVVVFTFMVAGFLLIYFFMLYLLARWRLKKSYRNSVGNTRD